MKRITYQIINKKQPTVQHFSKHLNLHSKNAEKRTFIFYAFCHNITIVLFHSFDEFDEFTIQKCEKINSKLSNRLTAYIGILLTLLIQTNNVLF